MQKELQEINEEIISFGLNSNSYSCQKKKQFQWVELCHREEEYWWQKSRELWLSDGDHNTKFFNALTSQKKASKSIFSITEQLTSKNLLDEASIKREGIRFFKELLDASVKMDVNNQQINSFLEVVPRIILGQDNDALMKPFTLEEI